MESLMQAPVVRHSVVQQVDFGRRIAALAQLGAQKLRLPMKASQRVELSPIDGAAGNTVGQELSIAIGVVVAQ